jgi:beta-galactosidase
MKLVIKSTVFAIALLIANCTIIHAQRQHINIDEGWKFHLGHAANAEKDFNYSISTIFSKSGAAPKTCIATGFNDSSWRTLNLPHDWAVELPFVNVKNFDVESHGFKPVGGLFPETSIGWYRKHFSVSKNDSNQRFQLQFDGVFRNASFWLNGFYLGNNLSGYVGVNYDVTDYINFNKENVLVVRVDATQYEGWFYEGAGIYRHVWLNQFNQAHINDAFISSEIDKQKVTVNVEIELSNNNNKVQSYSLEATVLDRNGNKIMQDQLPVSTGINTITKHIGLTNPNLWSIENPYLYRLEIVLKEDGKIVDKVTKRFGIRNIEIKPNGVFVNGQHVKIKGVNCHQDHAGVGSALPDYLQYYRIGLLKEMGVNAYRTSHNAPTQELLDACDSLGMLVMDEQRLLNSSPEYMDQFERLIKRDRSRPSVFMWSIGNEEGWIHTTSTGKKIAQTLIAKQKELDPTRTCTYAADVANVFKGVNEVIPVRSFNYRQYAVADYHKDHPNQPILGTEMGSTVTTRGIYEKDSIKGYVPDQDITAPWWASTAETWWTLAADNDFWLGGFVWTGFDYRGEPTPYSWPNINSHFGIMDMCGFPKNIYYYYQSWWGDKNVIHISPHWNWKGMEAKPIDVWVNSNADEVELFLNNKSLGRKAMPKNKHLQWMVNYAPGKLEAIGYKDKLNFTTTVESTGSAYTLVAEPSKKILAADGKDAMVINISVKDKEGRDVPDANNEINFMLEGDAQIIGVGNGDPSSHEPDKCEVGKWKRNLFSGKCQLIILAGKKPSAIKFSATADGLKPAIITLQSTQ